jgi:hypothetical protein
MTVYAKWVQLVNSVQMNLRPVPADPPLSNASLFVNEQAQFSVEDGYDSYTWYWNGRAIAGESSPTYTLPASSKARGTYELSVRVTTGSGETLSARCRVDIKAN